MLVKCPCCAYDFEVKAPAISTGCSEKKRQALIANAKKPRPGAKGKPKPRKKKEA